jgi:endonuclease I
MVLPRRMYSIDGFDSSKTGTIEVTVTHGEYQDTFFVTILHEQKIEIAEVIKTRYEEDSSFDENSIVVNYTNSYGEVETLLSNMYNVTGFDSSTPGTITLIVSYGDLTDAFDVTIYRTGIEVLSEYYKSAEGLSGQALFLELREIINEGFTGVTYGEARYILDESDEDPENPGNVILVYSAESVSGTWDYGVTWNREHVWPQSLLGVGADNSVVNVSSDLQNLKPANPSYNSSRLNKYFDNMTTSTTYEPRDEVKGDIARILLYMWTMYDNLELVDSNPSTYQMALLAVLLEWHELDPVDNFERHRNDIIYSYQNNRNPYIDYPEFVELIWGEEFTS